MADKAVDAMKKSVSSFWKYASGYATQMFTEEDLESEAIMIGDDKVSRPKNFLLKQRNISCMCDPHMCVLLQNPVLLDRLQAQLHALASDPETFLKDPDSRWVG